MPRPKGAVSSPPLASARNRATRSSLLRPPIWFPVGLSPGRSHPRMTHNETLAADNPSERRCVLTGAHGSRDRLIRLALGPDGQVAPDVRAKAPGRGAWIGVDRAALTMAIAKGKLRAALARAFHENKVEIEADLPERIERELARSCLDRLGLEARAGTLVTGSERIETAARAGQVALLLHAEDSGEDGRRRLDQAWRVGEAA